MKTVILCGGKGTRLSEETSIRPKPMVEIGSKPILYHIMNHYSLYGHNDFILALGYKGDYIKDYFFSFFAKSCDFTIDLKNGSIEYHNRPDRSWKVTLVDTGPETMTGGRLLRLQSYLENEANFMLTYGDGVSNVDLNQLIESHKSSERVATVTAVRPKARFGEMTIEDDLVTKFAEKPQTESGWINGGFFVFNKEIFNYLENDSTILEKAPLENLSIDGQLNCFKHTGFWQCMDTLRDKEYLHSLVQENMAPWMMI